MDAAGNLWFIHEKTLGVVDISGKTPRIIYLPELNNKMLSGFEFIYPYNENNIFLGGEKGFYNINFTKYKQLLPTLNVQVRSVRIIIITRTACCLEATFQMLTKPRCRHGVIFLKYPIAGRQFILNIPRRCMDTNQTCNTVTAYWVLTITGPNGQKNRKRIY